MITELVTAEAVSKRANLTCGETLRLSISQLTREGNLLNPVRHIKLESEFMRTILLYNNRLILGQNSKTSG